MPRLRIGVVLLLAPPVAGEVDGIRRALGDPALDRVAPHITLLPPRNVRDDQVSALLAVVRRAAGEARPLNLLLGPPTWFPTDEGVLYLAVGGDAADLERLDALRRGLTRPPLDRPAEHPFVPHVTLTSGVDAARLTPVAGTLDGFRDVTARFESVVVLREGAVAPHRWAPLADVALGPPVVVGRGGLPLELTPSDALDPEAATCLAAAGVVPGGAPAGTRPLVVAARREGVVVGVASGWTAGPVAELPLVWSTQPGDGVDGHLRAAWRSAAADRGAG